MKFDVDDKNRCRLVCVKFHLNRCRFAAAVAKCLGSSLFWDTVYNESSFAEIIPEQIKHNKMHFAYMLFSESFLLLTIQFHHRFAAHNVLYNQTFSICCFLSVSFCYETVVYKWDCIPDQQYNCLSMIGSILKRAGRQP